MRTEGQSAGYIYSKKQLYLFKRNSSSLNWLICNSAVYLFTYT